MDNNRISLRPVKELLGMNFFIPDYQRGYRWEKQQAIDFLEDICSFAKESFRSEKIYCIQPLVVAKKEEEILILIKEAENLEDIKQYINRYIKGSWTVVDGQQRLTTIYLLLTCLESDSIFEIDYKTRLSSKDFLSSIKFKKPEEHMSNIDYYHMYTVYSTIKDWLNEHQDSKEIILETLLNQVNFIWYQINKVDEIKVFTRLNIGKIPLTDSELIKALFLNQSSVNSENQKNKIALEWDQIEHTLQNDEFWAFINNSDYKKPTRIDFILDSICENDYSYYRIYHYTNSGRLEDNEDNKRLKEKIGEDEHKTFRYFSEAFNKYNNEGSTWLNDLWCEVWKYYQVLTEWYQDYRLYHYIGYLSALQKPFNITEYVLLWEGKTRDDFVKKLKQKIVELLKRGNWIKNAKSIDEIKEFKFDDENNTSKTDKTECVDILLLHNIETIIQQNEKIVKDSKYNLPDFSKFPFHLYKKEKWHVEHIRPNSGDNLKTDAKLYLSLAREYFNSNEVISKKIDEYINASEDQVGNIDIPELLTEIYNIGDPLPDDDKNKLYNFVLLDEKTNEEYGNQIFPVKREFIKNKINGIKIKYSFDGKLIKGAPVQEVAFVPPCTKNVFTKFYTQMPVTMINWNIKDAEAYWDDIYIILKDYFDELGISQRGESNE